MTEGPGWRRRSSDALDWHWHKACRGYEANGTRNWFFLCLG
jgi:hypothetical protein